MAEEYLRKHGRHVRAERTCVRFLYYSQAPQKISKSGSVLTVIKHRRTLSALLRKDPCHYLFLTLLPVCAFSRTIRCHNKG